jgi:hypothetical protein
MNKIYEQNIDKAELSIVIEKYPRLCIEVSKPDSVELLLSNDGEAAASTFLRTSCRLSSSYQISLI